MITKWKISLKTSAVFMFVRMLFVIIMSLILFIKMFPETGLGIILYAPFTFINAGAIAFVISFGLIKDPRYDQKKYFFEIGFYLLYLVYLLCTFVQAGDTSPIELFWEWLMK